MNSSIANGVTIIPGEIELIRALRLPHFTLVYGNCYIKIAKNNVLSSKKFVTLEDLRFIPCILVASRQQENNEQDFYQNTLGFNTKFIFAKTLEEAQLMVIANRGFMPIELIGDKQDKSDLFSKIPLYQDGK